MIKFQYFSANVTNNKPINYISIDDFVNITRCPKTSTVKVFKDIAEAEIANDFTLKKKLKQNNLHFFTPCVHLLNGRSYKNIIRFTGLAVLDFDHIDNAADFKYFLFNEYEHIIACWLSPSKKGVKALIKIPVVTNTNSFKSYFYGIADEMMMYKGFDPTGQNSVLPLFQSYDPGLFSRIPTITKCWRKKGKRKTAIDCKPIAKPPIIKPDSKNFYNNTVLKIIDTGFNNIKDNGHPQLRSLCLSVGGYVASNYIDYNTALNQIVYRIKTNNYLNKNINGYVKTAIWSLNQGKNKPLILNYE